MEKERLKAHEPIARYIVRWNKDLERIVELMEVHDLAEIEIWRNFTKLKVVRNMGQPQNVLYSPAPPADTETNRSVDAKVDEPAAAEDAKLVEIKSPTVGIFYTAPAPDKPPFVTPGDRISPGQVLCIVEAMKIMNEIPSEHAGKIVEVCASNEDPVEFGQVLFRLETG